MSVFEIGYILSRFFIILFRQNWIKLNSQNIMEWYLLVVHRSSETSSNQSDISIRSDDRFLNFMVDSDSLCWKKYMFNFILCFCLHTDKNLKIYPSVLLTLSQYTILDECIIYLLPSILCRCYTIHIQKPMFCYCI